MNSFRENFLLILRRPILLPFLVLSYLTQFLLRPDRQLKGSNRSVEGGGTFKKTTPLPSWRYEFGAARVGQKIYVVGGLTLPTVYNVTRRVEAYHLLDNSWSSVPDLPVIIHHPGVAEVSDRLYVVGGNGLRITPYHHVFEFDPLSSVWQKKAPMPTPRGALGVAVAGGLIYAVGGGTNKVARHELEVYDPQKDFWTRLPPMPTAREHLAVAAVGEYLFALGGYQKSLAESLVVNEAYNVRTGQWSVRAPLPLALSGFAAVAWQRSLFIFGGEQGWAVSGECHEYLVDEDRWRRQPDLPKARYALAAVSASDGIHLLGGNPYLKGFVFSLDHDVFVPS